jgi:tetratricopeptide (TPR) repeat protein
MTNSLEEFRDSFGDCEDSWRLFVEAYEAQMKGRYHEALGKYGASAEIHPTAEAFTFQGWTHSFLKEYNAAIDCCLRAIEADPAFGNPYNDIGSYLIALGRPREAIKWLRKAIRAPRYDPRQFPHCNLAGLYEELGRYDLAMRRYRKTLSIDPTHPIARRRLRELTALMN